MKYSSKTCIVEVTEAHVKHNVLVSPGQCSNSTLKEQEIESVPYQSLLLMWAYIQGFH